MDKCVDKCDICDVDLGKEDGINTLAFPQQGDMYTVELMPLGYRCPRCNHECVSNAPYSEDACGTIGQAPHKIFPTSPPLMHTMLL